MSERDGIIQATALKLGDCFTYRDYKNWETDGRCELIDGVPYMMSSPSQIHQETSGELYFQFHAFLKDKSCKVFSAPFDVRINAKGRDDTVVQPDLLIVCDKSKLDGKSCVGAPDMVIEIVSPPSARMDRIKKLSIYEKAGVREFWLVEPDIRSVQVLTLENGKYVINGYTDEDTVTVSIFEGFELKLSDVFPPETGDTEETDGVE